VLVQFQRIRQDNSFASSRIFALRDTGLFSCILSSLFRHLKQDLIYVKPAKIESDVVTVRILNKDEMLTEEDMKGILNAMDEREKGHYYKLEEVFE
jgi:hypothetical protein